MEIDIRSDIARAIRGLDFEQKQVSFAASVAINDVLKMSQPAVAAEMIRVFERPTPWTRNSYRVIKWSNKRDLIGIVGFKDEFASSKGVPAGKYLAAEIEGGERRPKGLEKLLRARGLLSGSEFLVPSRFQRLDQYGNVSKGVIQKIISNLDAQRDRLQNTPAGGARRGAKKRDYFFTRRGVNGARITAIWQTFGTGGAQHAMPAFIVVTGAPRYRKRLDHHSVVVRQLQFHFPNRFALAYQRATATAR